MQDHNLLDVLTKVANQYPIDLVDGQLRDIPRIAFHIGIAVEASKPRHHSELEICDLGGGIGLFSAGCAAYGMKRTVLIDDFDDSVNHRVGGSILNLHKRFGVEVIGRDVVEKGIADIESPFDIITTFESMEHWHHSPKRLFHDAVKKLKSGGVFVLGVPNCVNLRKRITVPIGLGKWSSMHDWYEAERFRGHVREPDVNDLLYIANDMGLVDIRVLGRNWLGYSATNPVIRLAAKFLDFPLRVRPQLCSDIYLIGRKA